jgi:hypothetical protein
MILANPDDYEYPSIDWCCKDCGEVYVSRGYPNETRCTSGHGAGWQPNHGQRTGYAVLLAGLAAGDGVVVCGDGPAPLKGVVQSLGKGGHDDGVVSRFITVGVRGADAPLRKIRWYTGEDASDDDSDLKIEWCEADAEFESWRDVYHVERTDAADIRPAPDAEEEITALTGDGPTPGEVVFDLSIRSERRDGEWRFVADKPFTHPQNSETVVAESLRGLLYKIRDSVPPLELEYATDGGDA